MLFIVFVGVSMLLLNGCATTQMVETSPSPFTHGNVQLSIKKGVTTQSEILENFGPPNVATIDSSENEVWTYQKHATVSKGTESGVYGTVILFGASSGTSGFEQSSRTMTLIIKFDKTNTVSDFKSMYSSF
jgi:hypothetical protein